MAVNVQAVSTGAATVVSPVLSQWTARKRMTVVFADLYVCSKVRVSPSVSHHFWLYLLIDSEGH
jgi:hypothetical protein